MTDPHITQDYNFIAENVVIAAILRDETLGDLTVEIMNVVKSGAYFSNDAAREIYRAAKNVLLRGEPLSYLTVINELTETGKLDKIGGPAIVSDFIIPNDIIPHHNAMAAARMVADSYHKRNVLETAKTIYQQLAMSNGNIQTDLQEASERFRQLGIDLASEKSWASPFKIMSLAAALSLPAKEWLIEGIIGKGDVGMMFGEQETGKTFVLIDLMFSAAIGANWCGRFNIPRPLKVAYCTAEGQGGIPQRLKAAMNWYGPECEALLKKNVTIIADVPQLFDPQSSKNVHEFISAYRAQIGDDLDLLIIDTLHNASVGSNENDQGDAAIVIQSARAIRDAFGCAVKFGHHANRKGTGYRGSSAYAADMDVMIEISGHTNPRKMGCYKAKDAEKFDNAYFQLRPVENVNSVVAEWLGDSVSSSIKETNSDRLLQEMKNHYDQFLTARQWAEAIGLKNQTQANPILAKMVERKIIQKRLRNEGETNSKSNPWVYGIVNSVYKNGT